MNNPLDSKDTRIKGFYVMPFVDTKRIRNLIDHFVAKIEPLEFLHYTFPSIGLIEDLEKEKEHFKINAEVFTVEGKPWFLKPTSEAIAYPYIYGNQAINLPFKWYSVGPAFRNESKATLKYLRGKEISYFFEGHSIYSNEMECKTQLLKIRTIFEEFFQQEGIPYRIHLRPPQDTFPGAMETYAFDTMVNGKPLQIATLHYLGTNFSKAYRANNHVYGLCFGFTERLIGALKGLYKDNYKYFCNTYAVVEFYKTKPLSRYPAVKVEMSLKKVFQRLEQLYDPVIVYNSTGDNPFYRSCVTGEILKEQEVPTLIKKTRSQLYSVAKKKVEIQFESVEEDLGILVACSI